MFFVFIDYTSLYFRAIVKNPLPPVVGGKFVQIRNVDTEYLVFSPAEFTKYHAGIVERFCLDAGIEGSYDSERKRYNISDKVWTIVGGGKFEIDRRKVTIRLFGDSAAYGKFDPAGLAEKIFSVPEFAGFEVLMD